MNGRSLMAAGPHRDTRAYGVVFDGPAAFQGGRHRSQRGSVDSNGRLTIPLTAQLSAPRNCFVFVSSLATPRTPRQKPSSP